jgi:hypothetical protein
MNQQESSFFTEDELQWLRNADLQFFSWSDFAQKFGWEVLADSQDGNADPVK